MTGVRLAPDTEGAVAENALLPQDERSGRARLRQPQVQCPLPTRSGL